MVVEMACPSPMGVMFRGTGLLLGAISIRASLSPNTKISCNYLGLLAYSVDLKLSRKEKRQYANPASKSAPVSSTSLLYGACQVRYSGKSGRCVACRVAFRCYVGIRRRYIRHYCSSKLSPCSPDHYPPSYYQLTPKLQEDLLLRSAAVVTALPAGRTRTRGRRGYGQFPPPAGRRITAKYSEECLRGPRGCGSGEVERSLG